MKRKELFQGLVFSLILLFAMSNNGSADTPVSGIIGSDTTWTLAESPYIVTGSVLVMEGVTLTIEPGVVVKFDSGMALQINGTLIARGTRDSMATFTSAQAVPAAGDWGHIFFTDTSVDATYDGDGNYTGGSILEYCIVEYGSGILLQLGNPFINYCTIQHNSGTGIFMNSHNINNTSATLKITNNTISNNNCLAWCYAGGVALYGYGTVIVSNNMITNNSGSAGGIYAGSYTATFSNNTITNNTASDIGGGIYNQTPNNIFTNNVISSNTARNGGGIHGRGTISNNIITNNTASQDGGGFYAQSDATFSNNTVSNNIANYRGGGIYAEHGSFNISNNTISENTGGGIYLLDATEPDTVTISRNSITNNNGTAVYYHTELDNQDFNYNIITGNSGSYAIYIGHGSGCHPNFQYNNIFNSGVTYELYNGNPSGGPNLDATNNYWGTTVESEIQAMIYDWFDDPTKGIVDYTPWLMSHDTNAPISPPMNVTVTDYVLNWAPNPESDIDGYKVYWGTQPAPFFENVVDVGDSTSYTVPGDAYYIGVTAYDTDYAEANDDPDTIVNENQTNGHESWYAIPTTPLELPSITVNPDQIDFGDVIVGRQYEVTLEIGNDGNADLNVTNITHDLDENLEINPSPPYEPPLIVAPSATTTVTLTFTVSVEGEINGTLSIESNDPTSPTEIDISAVAKILVGDLSGDGSVSAYDAALILQFVVGLITEFPIESMMASSPYDIEPRNYEISIPDVAVKQGEIVQVPVVVNEAKGMQAGGIVVKYDRNIIKAIDATPTGTLSSSYWERNINAGEIRFAFASMKPVEGGDKLLMLEFEALPNTEGTVSPLILDHVKLKESLSLTKKNGSITVLPSKSLLLQNYPNPFNPETWIPYKLATDSPVMISIYNAKGQKIKTIALGNKHAGVYITKEKAAYWDSTDSFGQKVASGVYFYTLQAGSFRATQKMVIMK